MKKRGFRRILCIATFACFAACNDDGTPVDDASMASEVDAAETEGAELRCGFGAGTSCVEDRECAEAECQCRSAPYRLTRRQACVEGACSSLVECASTCELGPVDLGLWTIADACRDES